MKKGIMMVAAAMMCVSATSCKASVMPEDDAPATIDLTDGKVDTTGYTTTKSGLKYKEVRKGTGRQPSGPNAVVKVHYAGKHLDGTVFDSSYDRGEPISFPLNRVIPGWTEGVQLMKEGAKYQFIIPSGLAYGSTGTPGGSIAPNEDLYFEVELLEVQ